MKNTHEIKIETLTPVHIGSGRVLHPNFDYLIQDKKVVLIDEEKILHLIGPEAISSWIAAIENNSGLMDYLNSRKLNVSPDSIGSRSFACVKSVPSASNTIREQIHTGAGIPYIPGSSLKGSLRTAVFADQMKRVDAGSGFFSAKDNYQNKRGKYSDDKISEKIFGSDPNHDVMRFVRIGDIHFDDTACVKSQTLNTNRNGEKAEIKGEVDQFIECIPAGAVATGTIQIPSELVKRVQERKYIHSDSMETLTSIINSARENTEEIIKYDELAEFYREIEQSPEIVDDIQELLKGLLKSISALKENQCILRLGFGSGLNFMTGGWINTVFENYPEWSAELRNEVRSSRYEQVRLFPKSRKILEDGTLLGFIKLTIV